MTIDRSPDADHRRVKIFLFHSLLLLLTVRSHPFQGIMIDDDGTGYVAFAANPPGFDEPGHPHWPGHTAHGYGHIVSIERMSPDLLRSSKVL